MLNILGLVPCDIKKVRRAENESLTLLPARDQVLQKVDVDVLALREVCTSLDCEEVVCLTLRIDFGLPILSVDHPGGARHARIGGGRLLLNLVVGHKV